MSSTYLSLNVHLIFSTKNRAPVIRRESWPDVHAYLGGVAKTMGATPIQIGGVEDHVHMLLGYKATHSVSNLAQEIKKVSSNWMKELVPDFAWQVGYAGLSVSPDGLFEVSNYIRNQEAHHKTMTFKEERLMLLKLAGIEFDPKYLD